VNKNDVQSIKEEVAQLATRLDNIEGYFQNFDATLNNHMNDYKKTQDEIREEQGKLRELINDLAVKVATLQGSEKLATFLIKWVVVPLIGLLAGIIGVKVVWPGAI